VVDGYDGWASQVGTPQNKRADTHFVPMLLHATLGAQREGLCNLAPAAAGISQRLESLFFGGSPRCVCAPFLWQRAG